MTKEQFRAKRAEQKERNGQKIQAYAEKHPKFGKVLTYVNEHKTLLQFIWFMFLSLFAFLSQLAVQYLVEAVWPDTSVRAFWIFGKQPMNVFMGFLFCNIVAKVVSYILNRKKTFAAVNNLAFSLSVYVAMCVALILVETLVGNVVKEGLMSIGLPESLSGTFSVIVYSIPDFLIVFLMEKFVIMNNNLFKKKTAQNDESTQIVEQTESVDDDKSAEPEIEANVITASETYAEQLSVEE